MTMRDELIQTAQDALCGGGDERLADHHTHPDTAETVVAALLSIPGIEVVALPPSDQKTPGSTTTFSYEGWYVTGNSGRADGPHVTLANDDGDTWDLDATTSREIALRLLAAANEADAQRRPSRPQPTLFEDDQLLAVDQLGCSYHLGVPTAWLNESETAIAVTADRRRGLAALHAQARRDLGGPARLDGTVQTAWVQFRWDSAMNEWRMVPSTRDADGAVAVVIAHGIDLVEVNR